MLQRHQTFLGTIIEFILGLLGRGVLSDLLIPNPTDKVHPETCGVSFSYGRAICANSGECSYLFNQNGI